MSLTFKQFLIEQATKPGDVKLSLAYHSKLNPDVWSGKKMKFRVRQALLKITDEFLEFLEAPKVKVKDVTMTGSLANYNWTRLSDIDLHIVVTAKEKDDTQCLIDLKDAFDTKKTLWNELHNISIYGHPVEVYIQMADEKHTSTGVYSVKRAKWIAEPKIDKKGETYNENNVKTKVAHYMTIIDKLIDSNATEEAIEKIKEKLRNMRKSGLEQAGEFSVENLTFKQLRANGYIEKLYRFARERKNQNLSLEK